MADTRWTPILPPPPDPQEAGFQRWYAQVANKAKINPNPDDPNHHYDYRAFYRDMMAGGKPIAPEKAGQHFTSEYKLPGHPRMFLQDSMGKMFDTKSAQYVADSAPVSRRELVKSEQAPDMPDMTPEKVKQLQDMAAAMKIAAAVK